MGFLLGFACGITFTLVTTPLLIKWYIHKKIKDITGGLLE